MYVVHVASPFLPLTRIAHMYGVRRVWRDWRVQEDAAGPSDPQAAPGSGKGGSARAKEITARPTASPRLVELVQVRTWSEDDVFSAVVPRLGSLR